MEIPGFDDAQVLGDSMLEEIRSTAERRLHQIEPLIEEAERLRDVLEVLGRRNAPGDHTRRPQIHKARRATSRPAARSQGGSADRAAKGSNKRTILALVADRPGITASEISQLTGMKRTVVASTVSRLKRYGELLDHDSGGVCVPKAATEGSVVDPSAANAPRRPARSPRPRRLAPLQQRRAA